MIDKSKTDQELSHYTIQDVKTGRMLTAKRQNYPVIHRRRTWDWKVEWHMWSISFMMSPKMKYMN